MRNLDRREVILGSSALVLGLSTPMSAFARATFYSRRGNALLGYDVVSYFETGQPTLGKPSYNVDWMGSQWYFSTAEHRDLFESAPESYAPQYGGYCAYAAARNYIYRTDPKAFTVLDNKLYLNANQSVRQLWIKDPSSEIRRADLNWIQLSKQLL